MTVSRQSVKMTKGASLGALCNLDKDQKVEMISEQSSIFDDSDDHESEKEDQVAQIHEPGLKRSKNIRKASMLSRFAEEEQGKYEQRREAILVVDMNFRD